MPRNEHASDVTSATGSSWLRKLHWTILRPLASTLGGDERSLFRGPGMDLNEVREYQPGDDVRLIDWNITARSDLCRLRPSSNPTFLDAGLHKEDRRYG